ncbi:MAG: diacylglycerol kinase family protein, partial [Clostridia bacterium]|nr:diacylglycerol kinase family protein [Clostridia bacterium]
MTHLLYNPFSGNGEGKVRAEEAKKFYEGKETEFVDMTSVDYSAFFANLPEGDDICICGGDGTLNRFVNDTENIEKKCDIFYFATGTGSDFWHELGRNPGEAPIKVNEYLADLPVVEIAGKKMRVLNGVGYGIDGYCCEVADVIREK